MNSHSQRAIVIMGVSGSGKSTIAKLLAEKLAWRFIDADDFHPQANRSKLSQGIALTDSDRWPWLDHLAELIGEDTKTVLACSALKEIYRLRLQKFTPIDFVYLDGDFETISQRLSTRSGHFMNPQLLDSQFATLEVPKECLKIKISESPESIIATIEEQLQIK